MQPGFINGTSVQFFAESAGFRLEFLSFGIKFPAFSEDIFDTFHVGEELAFDLAGPDYGACDGG